MRIRVLILILIWILNQGCNSNLDSRCLYNNISKFTDNTIDLNELFGNKVTIIKKKIKDGKLLITGKDKDKIPFICVIDLLKKKIEDYIKLDNEQNGSFAFDINGNELIYVDISELKYFTIYNLKSHETQKKEINSDGFFFASEILIIGNLIYFINSPATAGIYDLITNKFTRLNNSGVVTNYHSIDLAYPFDSVLNLIPGNLALMSNIDLYAIDSKNKLNWEYRVKQIGEDPINMLRFSNMFILKYDNNVVALKKNSGEKKWQIQEKDFITKIYKWKDKILLYSIINPIGYFPDNKDFQMKIVLKLIDLDGVELWDESYILTPSTRIGIINDKLILTDYKKIIVILISNGKVIFSKEDNNNNQFDLLMDISNGNYYLYCYDNMIYW